MAKPIYTVSPQRSDGSKYVDCPIHQATIFAVKKTERRRVRDKYYFVSTVIGRYGRLAEANLTRQHYEDSHKPLARAYRLGKLMGVRV